MKRLTREEQVAELHRRCLENSFLASLGVPFLTLMYESMASARDSVLITEERDGRVVGFITGGLGMRGTYHRMLRHPFKLVTALGSSFVRPRQIRKIWEVLRYGTKFPANLPTAELLSLAVDPACRGAGVAETLYGRLSEELRRRGVSAFKITVGEALAPAHRFYRRMGASLAAELNVHGAEKSVVYVQLLSGDQRRRGPQAR